MAYYLVKLKLFRFYGISPFFAGPLLPGRVEQREKFAAPGRQSGGIFGPLGPKTPIKARISVFGTLIA